MGKGKGHTVTCFVCGRRGSVAVGRGGKIADTSWNFFGTFNVNAEAGEAFYLAKSASPVVKPKPRGGAEAPTMRKLPIEYWECEDCFRDVQEILKKASK